MFKARIIQTIDDLKAIEGEWSSLYSSVPECHVIFSSWQYVFTFASFHDKHGWLVIAIYTESSDELVGIFPLEVFAGKLNGVDARACRSLGTKYAYYTDYLVCPAYRADVITAFLTVVRDTLRCDLLHFGAAHERSINYLMLVESLDPADYRLRRNRNVPYVDARSISFADYFVNKKHRRVLADAKRNARRLSELGNVDFTLHSDVADVRSLIGMLLQIHEDKFSDDHHYGRLDGNWKDFFARLFEQKAAAIVTELSVLRLNGEVVAACMGFSSKGVRCYYLPVYMASYAKFAPGKVLLMKLLERSFEDKDFFCFGPGLHPYKGDWSQATAETKQMWIFLSDRSRTEMAGRISENFLSLFDAA